MRHIKNFSRRVIYALTAMLAFSAVQAAVGTPNNDKLIISGASGGLAGETIAELLARGVEPSRLILVSRTPEKTAALAARGATTRKGDFSEPDSLSAAFAGGTRMLMISTGGGDRMKQHANAIEAAKKAGVRHIIYTSFVNAVRKDDSFFDDHRKTEELLKKSGLAWTFLRDQIYSDGLVQEGAQAVATGQMVTNSKGGRWAPVARKDIAAAAAAVLATTGHEGKIYDITGPTLITQADVAKWVAEITGKPVKLVELDDDAYIAQLTKQGAPPRFADITATLRRFIREGYLAIQSNAVKELTGREPQSVRELLVANKATLLEPPKPASE
jgi:NAD(P)H dehydrogenase (quinone)